MSDHEVFAQQARTRIRTILESDAAKGRTALANHIAFESDLTAEQAIAALNASARPSDAQHAAAQPANVQSSWSKAVADANRRFEAEGGGVDQPGVKLTGWAKAIAEANASIGADTVH